MRVSGRGRGSAAAFFAVCPIKSHFLFLFFFSFFRTLKAPVHKPAGKVTDEEKTLCSVVSALSGISCHSRFSHRVSILLPVAQRFLNVTIGVHCPSDARGECRAQLGVLRLPGGLGLCAQHCMLAPSRSTLQVEKPCWSWAQGHQRANCPQSHRHGRAERHRG